MRKVSFPHMGPSHVAFSMLLEDLGHEVVPPPTPSKRTLSYGTQYAPEFACLPFKVLTGTYVEVIEKGANTIVSSGGVGPCRAGYYGVLQEKILRDIGYDPEFIIFEPPLRAPLDF